MSMSTTPSAAPSLVLDGVSIDYGKRRALRHATLSVRPGELMALVGPSGCGKSSLLASINRMSDLVAGCRVEGRILLDGVDVRDASMPVQQLRRDVGLVFQQANPFPISIAENILFPLREHGVRETASLRARMERALREVGLWEEVADRLEQRATTLSGGQQQRLCIARALALEPRVMLFDEPCSALDPLSSERIERLICSLKGRYTIVMVTHNLAQARRMADSVTVCWVDDGCGCVIESGGSGEVFEHSPNAVVRAYCAGRIG